MEKVVVVDRLQCLPVVVVVAVYTYLDLARGFPSQHLLLIR
jgi:hypothetical protein